MSYVRRLDDAVRSVQQLGVRIHLQLASVEDHCHVRDLDTPLWPSLRPIGLLCAHCYGKSSLYLQLPPHADFKSRSLPPSRVRLATSDRHHVHKSYTAPEGTILEQPPIVMAGLTGWAPRSIPRNSYLLRLPASATGSVGDLSISAMRRARAYAKCYQ
ncbi:hypothetical protein BJX76DRAFT_337364 [Aspergillus varians]